jgi:hypothetical protein
MLRFMRTLPVSTLPWGASVYLNNDIKKYYSVSATEAVSGCTSVAIRSKVFIINTSTDSNFILLGMVRDKVLKLRQL